MTTRTVAAVLSAMIGLSLLTALPAQAAVAGRPAPAAMQLDAHGGEVRGIGWPYKPPPAASIPKPVWPTSLSRGNKIWVDRGAVQVLDRQQTLQAWPGSLLVRVSDNAKLSVDYNSFRYAAGGDWASRLRLWQVPECAQSTPDRRECHVTPLRATNDVAAGVISAQVSTDMLAGPAARGAIAGVDAARSSSGGLVMLAAEAAGESGDFTATSLSASSTWSGGSNSGGFSWSYPLRMPPAPGLQPSVSLSYSSSSVDGRSEATNNQPSILGEGFEYSPGFIERRYVPCSVDMADSASNTVKTGDQCWRSDNATMSLNGAGGELIFESGKGWHSRSEDGSRIEKLTGASNEDNDGEYWKVTAPDGTQYFFGRHNLPGQSLATNSVYTTPVFGNHSGEPCRAGSFAASSCVQAYRWNLDYVVDPRGNTMSYWYEKESNKYARNIDEGDDVSYTRAGVLRRIDYGTYYRTMAEHGIAQTSVTPVAQVVFDYGDRCLSNCWSGSDPVLENWPDAPVDQLCKDSATSCPQKYSPTFWTMKRLTKITAKVGAQDIDSWTFSHSFPSPGDGTHAGLWLDSIVRSGHVGGTVTLPPVTFEPTSLPNRVLTAHNTTNNWLRISNIVSESGAKTHIDYSLPECTSSNKPAAPHTNTMRCYPVLVPDLSADPSGKTLMTEWWHKYVVTAIRESDVQLADGHQAPSKLTSYDYVGAPAWHYTDDDGLSKPDRRTWSDYRGYAMVKTRIGDNPATQTLTTTSYLRGMHNDRLNPSGGVREVTAGASLGSETVYDEDAFAGMVREQVVYNGVETKPVSKLVNVPWQSTPTASRGEVRARFTGTSATYTGTALGVDGARGWRVSRTQTGYDNAYGTVNWTQQDDDNCVSTSYNRNAAKNILTLVKQTTTLALPCGQSPATVDDVISDVRNYYDGATSVDTAPVFGAVTKVEQLKDWTTGTQWQVASQSTYDSAGRVATATDLKGNTTSTAYTPSVGGPVTKVTTTGPAPFSWVSSVDLSPYWGAKVKTVDPNGKVVGEADYDPLGRTARVWSLGWARAGHENTPSIEYAYNIPAGRDTYSFISTKTLNATGSYVTAYQIYDALLRVRQVQTILLSGESGRLVTDTLYDSQGQVATTYTAHAEPGSSSGTLWWEPEWSVPALTRTEYDRASRATAQVLLGGDGETNLVEKTRTVTAYEGDLTIQTPPAGGVVTTTVSDIQGRTIERRLGTLSSYYRYNRKGQLHKLVDAAGNEWVSTYDAKGRKTVDQDPDKGQTLLEYNDFDEQIKATDARGEVLYTVYDQLGRRKELRDDSATGALRAEWKYDTLYSGQTGFRGHLTQAIRYEPAGSGNAYKWQVRQMTGRYQPGGINIVVPAVETGLGGTYVYSYGYSSFTGAPTSTTFPAAGDDLPVEQITIGYDSTTGLPIRQDTNWIGQSGTMATTTYDANGQPLINTRKMPGGVYVDETITYDQVTRRVSRITVKPETSPGNVSDRQYKYDDAGNILSVSDGSDQQCFRYDQLGRLEHAWTNADCGSNPSTAALTGPAPYWHQWGFDTVGNRTTETVHTGSTRQYALPSGGAGVVRPHAVTSMNTGGVVTNYEYDAAGNMTCRNCGANGQTLGWDAEGKLANVLSGGSTVESNVYDADGVRIVRRDSGGTTLYLPGQEIRRVGTVKKGTRYYDAGTRTGNGLTWTFNDHQRTQQITVKADTQAVSIRRQTPYGAARGTAVTWPSEKGFVGGDGDPTGLVNIGARQYDLALGRFISTDPLMVVDDPMQWDAYQYGASSPVSKSDPTGTCVLEDEVGGACYHNAEQAQKAQEKKEAKAAANARLQKMLDKNNQVEEIENGSLPSAPTYEDLTDEEKEIYFRCQAGGNLNCVASAAGAGNGGPKLSDREEEELEKSRQGLPADRKIVAAAKRKIVAQEKHDKDNPRNAAKRREQYGAHSEAATIVVAEVIVGAAVIVGCILLCWLNPGLA